MSGYGPLPKLQHQRERNTKRQQISSERLASDGIRRGPDLPVSIVDPHPETAEWWSSWQESAQAQLFVETDWASLKRAAILVDFVWKAAKPTAAALSELRLIEERFGATYVDRQRARIVLDKDTSPSAAVTPLHGARTTDLMDRLYGNERVSSA
jgi:hypothetical protein